MPIYEVVCPDCGYDGELIQLVSSAELACPNCQSPNVEKKLSPTSSMTGKSGPSFPGRGDTACCGSSPDKAGCAGPGSCCGKAR